MIPCPHRLKVINRTELDGQPIEIWRCVLESCCTVEARGLVKSDGQVMAVCSACTRQGEQATAEQIAAATPRKLQNGRDCAHRLDVIRSEPCTLCGSQAGSKGDLVQISECELFGECAPARYRAGQTARPCSTCGSFQPRSS